MNIYLPSQPVWMLIGIVLGFVLARLWLGFTAYCDQRTPPRWIPWRTLPCEGCEQHGAMLGYEAAKREFSKRFYRVDWNASSSSQFFRDLNMDTCDGCWFFKASSPEIAREHTLACPGIESVVKVEEVTSDHPEVVFENGRYVKELD